MSRSYKARLISVQATMFERLLWTLEKHMENMRVGAPLEDVYHSYGEYVAIKDTIVMLQTDGLM